MKVSSQAVLSMALGLSIFATPVLAAFDNGNVYLLAAQSSEMRDSSNDVPPNQAWPVDRK